MNIKHLESVIERNVCPACSTGKTREIGHKVYRCNRTRCAEIYDFSLLTDAMIRALLVQRNAKRPKVAGPTPQKRKSARPTKTTWHPRRKN